MENVVRIEVDKVRGGATRLALADVDAVFVSFLVALVPERVHLRAGGALEAGAGIAVVAFCAARVAGAALVPVAYGYGIVVGVVAGEA